MTTGHVFIATSLDGFVARRDHRLDWLMKQNTEGEDHGYEAFLAGVDGLVMGSGSYKTVLGFGDWPYAKPVIVMSTSLSRADVPAELADRVRVTDLGPRDLMRELQAEGWSRAYIDGGQVVQSFLRANLIRDLVVTLVPILIGEGRRLFGEIAEDIDLDLLGVTSFPSGLVQTRYKIKPAL
ncbi:dihydrofolate reductase family protein [Algihabitans albus]|uniref:dihydrofolate reductase family protein n=1 Tax=Algihabitans albus TaxID=2164067 RepID=UPI000E5C9219|nr:dihydrofolate reductase family protein [Algihabitans albus]